MEWLIAIAIIAPALWMAARHSSWLLDYAIIVLAFNRGIRRVVDYYCNGEFNPFSPISLTPLVVAGVLLIPVVFHSSRLLPRTRQPFLLLVAAVSLGFIIGLVLNRFAAVYSLAEWNAGLGAMAFAAMQPGGRAVADRWIKTAGWCAVVVAGYGWWQYYTIPPWDGMWLVQSGMVGYMGQPEPTEMTVFSTLNERGPCGTFLAWAVIPMIIHPRWRNTGGWLSVALLLSGIALTQTRTNLLVIGIVAVVYPALSKGRGVGRLLILAAVIAVGATWGVDRIPGMDKISQRFGAESLHGEGSSLRARIGVYQYGVYLILGNPLGLGLGSSGMGERAGGGAAQWVGDSGYIQIFAQFGWVGGLLFFVSLWLLWRELGRRWSLGCKLFGPEGADPFVPATRAILLGSLVFLFATDMFAGFSLLWVFFGRALSLYADPEIMVKMREALAKQALSSAKGADAATD